MRIKLILLILSYFLLTNTFSQKFYFNASGGYHLPILKQTINDFREYSTADDEIILEKSYPLGFANGINWNLVFGTKPFENFAFELGFSQVYGEPYEVILNHNINTVTRTTERSLKANSSYFSFGAVITSNYELINPYMRFDALLGFCNFDLSETIIHPSSVIERTWEYNTNTQFGYRYNLGATIALKKKYELFIETSFQNITFTPYHAFIVESQKNNKNNMEEYLPIEKEINYVDLIEKDVLMPPNENEPEERLKEDYSFSSFSFKLGVRINLTNYD
jgi:hypothetical protein